MVWQSEKIMNLLPTHRPRRSTHRPRRSPCCCCLLLRFLIIVTTAGIVQGSSGSSADDDKTQKNQPRFWEAKSSIAQQQAILVILCALFLGIALYFGDFSDPQVVSVAEAARDETDPQVYLDISIQDKPVGRIVIQLFASVTPKTCENFRALCTGEKGVGKVFGKPLYYRKCAFHRIIPGFMCQGGDITEGDGTGGESIYQGEIYGGKFADEWNGKYIAHSEPFLLSMANSGRHSNGSQFFLTTAATPWLDQKHVVFGRVIKGVQVVKQMEAVGSPSGHVRCKVVIEDCGEIKTKST